jgi:hypothetical protein
MTLVHLAQSRIRLQTVPEVAYLQPRAGLTANGLSRIISKQGDRMVRVNFRTNT